MLIYIRLLTITWWRNKNFVGRQVQRKFNTWKFSYHKEIEQFVMVRNLLRRKFFTKDFFSWIFPTINFSQTMVIIPFFKRRDINKPAKASTVFQFCIVVVEHTVWVVIFKELQFRVRNFHGYKFFWVLYFVGALFCVYFCIYQNA